MQRTSEMSVPDLAESAQHRFLRLSLKLLRLSIGLILLYLAMRDVQLRTVWLALQQAHPGWLAIVLVTILATLAFKTWRWALLLRPVVPEIRLTHILGALLVGQAANILLPLRSGDLVRSWMGSANEPARLPAVITGLVIEKGLDALMLALAMALVVPTLPADVIPSEQMRRLLGLGLFALAAALLALVASPRVWPQVRRPLKALGSPLGQRALRLGDRFASGMAQLRGSGRFGTVLALTLLSWVAMYATNQSLAHALDLGAAPMAGLLVLVLVFLAIIPRLMPGQVGPFYFFARLGLEQFGVDPAASTGYAVLLHALFLLPPLVGAGIYLLSSRNRIVHESARSP